MKLVYSHPNSMILGNMSSALNQEGIETQIRNDILGGATGEIAPGDTWIELWDTSGERVNAPSICRTRWMRRSSKSGLVGSLMAPPWSPKRMGSVDSVLSTKSENIFSYSIALTN